MLIVCNIAVFGYLEPLFCVASKMRLDGRLWLTIKCYSIKYPNRLPRIDVIRKTGIKLNGCSAPIIMPIGNKTASEIIKPFNILLICKFDVERINPITTHIKKAEKSALYGRR